MKNLFIIAIIKIFYFLSLPQTFLYLLICKCKILNLWRTRVYYNLNYKKAQIIEIYSWNYKNILFLMLTKILFIWVIWKIIFGGIKIFVIVSPRSKIVSLFMFYCFSASIKNNLALKY